MLDFLSKKGVICFGLFLAIFFTGISAQTNLGIHYKYCVATPDTGCFVPKQGAVDTVGRDVAELGGGYRFCLPIEEVGGGTDPIQVAIVIDRSTSMHDNDPDDMRVEAARNFVDSLRVKAPESYVGSAIFYSTLLTDLSINPLQLSNADSYNSLMDSFEKARNDLSETSTRLGTFQGLGLSGGLDMLLSIKETAPDQKQHIIMITDDGWNVDEDITPEGVLEKYRPQFPESAFPTIHSVVLTKSGNADMTGLENIEMIADSTGGLYIDNATPETIVKDLLGILDSIKEMVPNTLNNMTVTNLTNGEVRNNTGIETVTSSDNTIVQFQASMDNLPIEFGDNKIVVKQTVKEAGTGQLVDEFDTVTIFRTDAWTTTVDPEEYSIHCTDDKTTISIDVSPEMRFLNDTFTVNSTIILKENYLFDSVDVRIFTENNDTDPSTVAVYHLDNDLNNSTGDNTGTGAGEVFTDNAKLFGDGALSGGSFSTKIGNLSDDFAFEMWVRPSGSTKATDLFSVGGFVFGINDALKPFAADGGANLLTSEVALDVNVWSHIAVSRSSGKIILSVNGLSVTTFTAFDTPLNGAATITCPDGAILDEVRISNASRLNTETFADAIRFEVSSVAAPTWIHKGIASTQKVLTLPPGDWTNGKITFNFTSPVDGRLVVNFQHKGTSLASIWSKNGNPVFVAADLEGPYITHAILTPGPLNSLMDTLQVFFSEVVICDSLKDNNKPETKFKVFQFGADGSGGEPIEKKDVFLNSVFLSETCSSERADNGILDATMLISAGAGVVPGKDSIQLVGNVVDTFGNYPDPDKYGAIKYGPGSGITIGALELETGPGVSPMNVPEGIKLRLGVKENVAKIVMVQTRAPLVPVDTKVVNGQVVPNYSYRSVIYDAVANVVATDLVLKKNPMRDREYFIVWPGTNRANRQVSSGAYLLKLMVKYENELDKFVPLQTKFSIRWFSDTP